MTGISLAAKHGYLITIPGQLIEIAAQFGLAPIKQLQVVQRYSAFAWTKKSCNENIIQVKIVEYLIRMCIDPGYGKRREVNQSLKRG